MYETPICFKHSDVDNGVIHPRPFLESAVCISSLQFGSIYTWGSMELSVALPPVQKPASSSQPPVDSVNLICLNLKKKFHRSAPFSKDVCAHDALGKDRQV